MRRLGALAWPVCEARSRLLDAWWWARATLDVLTCAVLGHDVACSIDRDAGFDTYWCRRCHEGDL